MRALLTGIVATLIATTIPSHQASAWFEEKGPTFYFCANDGTCTPVTYDRFVEFQITVAENGQHVSEFCTVEAPPGLKCFTEAFVPKGAQHAKLD